MTNKTKLATKIVTFLSLCLHEQKPENTEKKKRSLYTK